MTPLKPYLIRALYDWIIDNDLTPYLLVDAEHPEAVVPRQYVQDGKIVLNLKPQAISALALGNRTIAFNARFGGTPMQSPRGQASRVSRLASGSRRPTSLT